MNENASVIQSSDEDGSDSDEMFVKERLGYTQFHEMLSTNDDYLVQSEADAVYDMDKNYFNDVQSYFETDRRRLTIIKVYFCLFL
jgi:hypothetical protein